MFFNRRLPKLYIMCSLLLVIFLVGCTSTNDNNDSNKKSEPSEPVVDTVFLMGTINKITIYDDVDNAEEIINKAFERIAEIEERMTINKEDVRSEIVELNESSGKDFVKLSPDTFFVLEKGQQYSEQYRGKYDVTIGPVVKLWNIGMEKAKLPKENEISEALQKVNFEHLILDKNNQSAKLTKPGMIVDLGSIAKGYAADEVARVLEEEGIKHAIINLGGNIVVLNKKPDGSYWKLGLQNPLEEVRGDYMGIVNLDNEALVTSGTYERFLEADGVNYHHILNTRTGYPENNDLLSVSIITDKSTDADALSTAIFLLGLEEGYKKAESLANVEAIFITTDKKVYQTSGINDQIFSITNEEFELHELEVVK